MSLLMNCLLEDKLFSSQRKINYFISSVLGTNVPCSESYNNHVLLLRVLPHEPTFIDLILQARLSMMLPWQASFFDHRSMTRHLFPSAHQFVSRSS